MLFSSHTSHSERVGETVPTDFWARLDRLHPAIKLELHRTVDSRWPERPPQWTITARHRESDAEQFSISSGTLPFVLALAVLKAEHHGLMIQDSSPPAPHAAVSPQ